MAITYTRSMWAGFWKWFFGIIGPVVLSVVTTIVTLKNSVSYLQKEDAIKTEMLSDIQKELKAIRQATDNQMQAMNDKLNKKTEDFSRALGRIEGELSRIK